MANMFKSAEPGRKGEKAKAAIEKRKAEKKEEKEPYVVTLEKIYKEGGLSDEQAAIATAVTMSAPPPVFQTVYEERIEYSWEEDKKYRRAREMLENDPELLSAVDNFGLMCQAALNEIIIRPGHDRDDKEELILEMAQDFGDHIVLPECFFAAGSNLLRDSDVVIAINKAVDPWEIVFLPMEFVTAVNAPDQVGVTEPVVTQPNIYLLDEQDTNLGEGKNFEEMKLGKDYYLAENIIHITWNNRGTVVEDNLGRTCYNVWSTSRLDSLKKLFEWKMLTIANDILWRNKMVPRLHHQMNLEAYAPEKFSGTWENKLVAARTAAQLVLTEYGGNMEHRKVDQDYITGAEVEIKVIESDSTNYHAPNELFEYFITVYCAISGVPRSSIKGESQGSFASDIMVNNYVAMRAEIMAKKIGRAFTKLIHEYLEFKYERNTKLFRKSDIKKIEVQTSLMFNKDYRELGRFISLIAATGLLTQDELRGFLGMLPLTDEDQDRLVMIAGSQILLPDKAQKKLEEFAQKQAQGRVGGARTPADSKAKAGEGGSTKYPDTPHTDAKGSKA